MLFVCGFKRGVVGCVYVDAGSDPLIAERRNHLMDWNGKKREKKYEPSQSCVCVSLYITPEL